MCKCTLIILFLVLMYFSIVAIVQLYCRCSIEVIVVCICIYIPTFSNIISSCLKLISGTGDIISYLSDTSVHWRRGELFSWLHMAV